MVIPTYQETMSLGSKLYDIEKKVNETIKKNILHNKIDSPALSITYQSDMVKNNDLSVKYVDLSDNEAKELLNKMNLYKEQKLNQTNKTDLLNNTKICKSIHTEELFDKIDNNINKTNDDCFSVGANDIVLNKSTISENKYKNILDNLTQNKHDFNNELDTDIIKHISESIHYADMTSQKSLSDIPKSKKTKL